MTKHIVGLILFSFIVGTSAFVAGLFYGTSDRIASSEIYSRFDRYAGERKKRKKRKCPPHRHPHFEKFWGQSRDVNLVDAAYDSNSQKFNATALFSRGTPEEFNLDLHFFVKDEFGTRFIKTESLAASAWTNNYEDEFDWLTRFPQRGELYLMAQLRPLDDDTVLAPVFEASKATPLEITSLPASNSEESQ